MIGGKGSPTWYKRALALSSLLFRALRGWAQVVGKTTITFEERRVGSLPYVVRKLFGYWSSGDKFEGKTHPEASHISICQPTVYIQKNRKKNEKVKKRKRKKPKGTRKLKNLKIRNWNRLGRRGTQSWGVLINSLACLFAGLSGDRVSQSESFNPASVLPESLVECCMEEAGTVFPAMASGVLTGPILRPFMKLLMNISDDIQDDQFKSMKFALEIPAGLAEKITHIRDLFSYMQRMCLLGERNLDLLVELLERVRREDVVRKVLRFRELHSSDVMDGGATDAQMAALPGVRSYLSNKTCLGVSCLTNWFIHYG